MFLTRNQCGYHSGNEMWIRSALMKWSRAGISVNENPLRISNVFWKYAKSKIQLAHLKCSGPAINACQTLKEHLQSPLPSLETKHAIILRDVFHNCMTSICSKADVIVVALQSSSCTYVNSLAEIYPSLSSSSFSNILSRRTSWWLSLTGLPCFSNSALR